MKQLDRGGLKPVRKRGSNQAHERISGTQAISRALAVLSLLQHNQTSLGVTQIAKALTLKPSTAHRILRALVAEGYLIKSDDTDRYHLGHQALLLGLAAQHNLGLDLAMPVLESLAATTSESVNLGVVEKDTALVVLRVASSLPLRFDQPPGTRVPLHASAIGKALLAFTEMGDSFLSLGDKNLTRWTPTTIVKVGRLREELRLTRERGYSVDLEEHVIGVRCIGAPLVDPSGQAQGAIALQAPSIRMPEARIHELAPRVIAAANKIGALLLPGHRLSGGFAGPRRSSS